MFNVAITEKGVAKYSKNRDASPKSRIAGYVAKKSSSAAANSNNNNVSQAVKKGGIQISDQRIHVYTDCRHLKNMKAYF